MNNYIALRMDDVGTSSKKFNVYSKYPFCNTLFLKYLPPFRACYTTNYQRKNGLIY